MNKLNEKLAAGILKLGIEVPPEMQLQLLEYLVLLQKWNRVYNLTAIRDPIQMVSHHLLDSLAITPYLWPKNWLDVGSGAGLPGLVLAITHPEWSFTLLDSNSKKTSFIQQAVIELGLKNVRVNCLRVEAWNTTERFDGIVTRAFSETSKFIALTQHLLADGGGWLAMKGVENKENYQYNQGVVSYSVHQLDVPDLEAQRCIIVIRDAE
jgi:16S rRNA (guanine527-N7)-methyltransferase